LKFSVLLPTRERLEYLKLAIESVHRQDDADWEIVVSDNCSEADVASYVASLADRRIRYVRTAGVVPVTENWNNALSHASGDYMVMLGDDDALMPGYFRILRDVIDRFQRPDFLYTGALLFAYPGALQESPAGYLQAYGYASFLRGAEAPYVLPPSRARALAGESAHFRIRFGFNAQFACVSRRLIDRLSPQGPFYQSPFPDYFSMNAMFLRAKTIVVVPMALVLIGITKKSYGFFHYSGKEKDGVAFLGASVEPAVEERLRRVILPGSNINNGWLYAMETLRLRYGIRVHYRRYRHVQIMYTLRDRYVTGMVSSDDLRELKNHLGFFERLIYTAIEHFAYRGGRRLAAEAKDLVFRAWRRIAPHWAGGPSTFMPWFKEKIEGRYQDAIDVYEHVDPSDPAWRA